MHQPEPFIGLVDIIELAKISFVSGEYLEDAKLYVQKIKGKHSNFRKKLFSLVHLDESFAQTC